MIDNNVQAYVIPHNDAHLSEYIAARDERVKFISGFSGSNGICLVTQDKAWMWTDGRYYLQAQKELEEGWQMMKMREPDCKDWYEVAYEEFKDLNQEVWIGADPSLLPLGSMKSRKKFWEEKNSKIGWKLLDKNLIDELWPDQPKWPEDGLIIHDEFKFVGRSVE